MRYWLEEAMTPVAKARDAGKALSIRTVSVPVRGSTDGSRLTELGGATPSVFTGMQNRHHPLEWISVQDTVQTTQILLKILECYDVHVPINITILGIDIAKSVFQLHDINADGAVGVRKKLRRGAVRNFLGTVAR